MKILIIFFKLIFFKFKFFLKKNLFILFNLKYFKNYSSKKNNSKITILKKHGFIVIKNFYSKKKCNKLKKEIDYLINAKKKIVVTDKDSLEQRIFYANLYSNEINFFYNNKIINKIANSFFNGPTKNLLTMANKLKFNKKKLGSGGGWHRDNLNFELKAILYLNKVTNKTGAFEIIENSNNFFNILRDSKKMNVEPNTYRFSNSDIGKLKKYYVRKIHKIPGEAGTLIIADTSSIHRGSPIEIKTKRYALTNYIYPHCDLKSQIGKYKI